MNRFTLLALAGLSLTSACATQPPRQASFETTASLLCQYDLADNERNYDQLYLASGRPAFDEHNNPNGLSGTGFLRYKQCMMGKGYDISEGAK